MDKTAIRTLAIIIGAGASSDCVAHELGDVPAENRITIVDPNLRPPLTEDLFASRPAFNQVLNRYPMAASLSEEIRSKISKRKEGDGQGLEQILRGLAESQSFDTKKHVWEIPLYLQELFWTISDDYIKSGRSKYNTLVRRVIDSAFDKVMFLTLNYDLLLDKAITEFTNHAFTSIQSYAASGKKWSLVKAHGSVNWAKTLINGPDFNGDHNGFMAEITEHPKFSSEIEVLIGGSNERFPKFKPQHRYGKKYKYPWMAIPAQGEKEFFCPDAHIVDVNVFLRSCRNFLFIGFSGLDPHVLELFRDVKRSHRFKVVCGGRENARAAYTRLFKVNHEILPNQHMGKDEAVLSDLGFADFIESDEFGEFLALD